MATITLNRAELEKNGPPPFCMRCGEPAALVKERRFFWVPDWATDPFFHRWMFTGWKFFFGGQGRLRHLADFTLSVRVPVSHCDRHRNQGLAQQVVLCGTLGIVALLLISTIVMFVMTAVDPDIAENRLAGWFCLGALVFLVIMPFPIALSHIGAIRPTAVTDQSITLTNVAEKFVAMVQEGRYGSKGARFADDYPPLH